MTAPASTPARRPARVSKKQIHVAAGFRMPAEWEPQRAV